LPSFLSMGFILSENIFPTIKLKKLYTRHSAGRMLLLYYLETSWSFLNHLHTHFLNKQLNAGFIIEYNFNSTYWCLNAEVQFLLLDFLLGSSSQSSKFFGRILSSGM
jgi:hypothetical protein